MSLVLSYLPFCWKSHVVAQIQLLIFQILCYFFRSANKDTLRELQVEADMYKTQLLEQKQQLREEKRYTLFIVITFYLP